MTFTNNIVTATWGPWPAAAKFILLYTPFIRHSLGWDVKSVSKAHLVWWFDCAYVYNFPDQADISLETVSKMTTAVNSDQWVAVVTKWYLAEAQAETESVQQNTPTTATQVSSIKQLTLLPIPYSIMSAGHECIMECTVWESKRQPKD